MSRVLDVPVQFFFDDMPVETVAEDYRPPSGSPEPNVATLDQDRWRNAKRWNWCAPITAFQRNLGATVRPRQGTGELHAAIGPIVPGLDRANPQLYSCPRQLFSETGCDPVKLPVHERIRRRRSPGQGVRPDLRHVVDMFLGAAPEARVACETLATTQGGHRR